MGVVSATVTPRPAWSPWDRYRHSLWLLTIRDLRVRYSTSVLGYFWSILDPLVMAGIYWFVFTQVFDRDVGESPYIVFLLTALLPWMWFNGAVGDCTRAFLKEARLIRSTKIPRTIWVNRLVLSKGIEFVASIPVLAIFAIFSPGTQLHWQVVFFPLAISCLTIETNPLDRVGERCSLSPIMSMNSSLALMMSSGDCPSRTRIRRLISPLVITASLSAEKCTLPF